MYNYDNYYQVKPVFKFPPFIFKGEPCVELTFVAVKWMHIFATRKQSGHSPDIIPAKRFLPYLNIAV